MAAGDADRRGDRGGPGADGPEPIEPALEARLVGEQDEERVVAGQRALLLAQRRLVDRLGDDAGRAGRPGQDQDEPAPADRDGDVGEDAAQALVDGRGERRARCEVSGAT